MVMIMMTRIVITVHCTFTYIYICIYIYKPLKKVLHIQFGGQYLRQLSQKKNFGLLYQKWSLGTQESFCKVWDQSFTRLNNYGLRERPFDFQGGGGVLVRLEYFFFMFSETEFFFQHHRGLEFFFQCMMREVFFYCTVRMNNYMY